MRIHTNITKTARERGFNAAEVSRRLGWYRSNVSAMDAGKRSVSLKALAEIAALLDLSPADLLETAPPAHAALFRKKQLMEKLQKKDFGMHDGTKREWVHAVMLAWQHHHQTGKSIA